MDTTFLLKSGKLEIGCNYWASHAGTEMWCKWNAGKVEQDFALLAEYGITILRVFPLWQDFQPVSLLRKCMGEPVEFTSQDGQVLMPDSDGLDPEMLARFRTMASLAQKYHLKLIVALLTGWMSGRLFVPPVLEGRNLYTDPEALRWEEKFIRGFINALKDQNSIIAWEPGNECNCLSPDPGEAASWHWLDFITKSIRSADPNRPVYSGMHGPAADPLESWNLFAQGEFCDGVNTHPYPIYTPHCGKSALNSLPADLHSTAETLFYRGISRKMGFVEEIGTIGPMILSEKRTGAYIRTTMMSAWIHDCRAFLWWCGFDQDHLDHAPYRWIASERELGLFTAGYQAKESAEEVREFSRFLINTGFDELPSRQIDAVALTVSEPSNQWHCAYGSFVLAKQSGVEIEFASPYRAIPKAAIYWLMALDGSVSFGKKQYEQLRNFVRDGASVLVTDTGRGTLQPFKEFTGCEVDYTATMPEKQSFTIPGTDEEIHFTRDTTRKLISQTAQVLIADQSGNSILTINSYGKGKVFYLNLAPETAVLEESRPQWYKVYRMIFCLMGLNLPEKAPQIGRTLHRFPDGRTLEILLNYADFEADGIPANSWLINEL